MASFDVLPADSNSSGSFPSGDYSMLHEVEVVPFLNGDSNHINFDFTNMQSTMNELSIEQNAVSSQITKLISNNLSMKEALDKTNSIMKEQLDNLPGLVASKFKQQQQNLQAAEEKISSLEKENSNLRSKLDFLLEEMSQNKGSKEFCTKFCPTALTDEETGYEIVHEKANEDYKELEKLEESIKQKDDELDILKKEKEYLKETLKTNDLKMQELENALKAQFELMNTRLKNESTVTEQYKKRCESLQEQLNKYQAKARMSEEYDFQEEIHNLQEILKMEQQAYQNVKDELSRVSLKFEKLQVDYDTATKLLEIGSRDEKTKIEEIQTAKASKEKEHLETIDHLTAQLFLLQEQFQEKNALVQDLETRLSDAEKDIEIIPILRAQVEVYKKDYEIALTAKDAAHDEVDRLANELKKSEATSMGASPSSLRRTSHHSINKAPKQEYICPVCKAGFTNERGVQNHVERCLNERSET